MNIEDRIRSRIEAILLNDARNHAELRRVALDDECIAEDPFAEDRNLYQRIISNYRNAVSEVNHLFEENVGFLSGFLRIIEGIKDKTDIQEICSRMVSCVLEDFGAEYCSVVFIDPPATEEGSLALEGVREDRKFLHVHSNPTLLGSEEFERAVAGIVSETSDCLNIADVYRDSRFDAVDFPSVVRSLVCLPLKLNGKAIGVLILSHSLPRFFNDNHLRVLQILAGILAHLRLLTSEPTFLHRHPLHKVPADHERPANGALSIILFDFIWGDPPRRADSIKREYVNGIRKWFSRFLEPGESIILHRDLELIMLLPGIGNEDLLGRVSRMREVFRQWKSDQGERARNLRMSLGFSTCEEGDDLSRTLEMAAMIMHPEQSQGPSSEH